MVGEREIEGHRGLTITAEDGGLEATFVPAAGMVCCSLRHQGEEVLGQRHGLRGYIEDHSTMGIPLLYPWANRLSSDRFTVAGAAVDLTGDPPGLKRDGAGRPIHGLLTAAGGWRVTGHEAGPEGGLLKARFRWTEARLLACFPFPHTLELEASITPASLRIRTTVTADGGRSVPIAYGFHPYLALPGVAREDWEVMLPVTEQLLLDDRGLPTGERRAAELAPGPLGDRTFDDLFATPDDRAPFALAGGGRRIELSMDASYPYAQIYAPPGEPLIAFEPMSAPTDALVSGGAPTVATGDAASAEFRVGIG